MLRLTTAKNEAEEPFLRRPTTSRGALGLAKTAGLEAGSGIKFTFDKQRLHHLVWNDWVKGAPEAQELDLLLHLSTCRQDLGQHGRAGLCPDLLRAFPDGATEEDARLFTAQVRGTLERLRSRHADQLCRPVANSQQLQLSGRACQIRDLIEREFGNPDLSLKNLSKRFRLSERHLRPVVQVAYRQEGP